ncbi:uncharacterized protein TRIADDRAFT_60608 [Trichoplax adhaerens]|uniref:Uncharacterized protein n=1 Tax=Trichoplax adhaerens TaxID=10228 RepID=B3S8P1_TRIAD|nr:predicted protein [Trichoplax adhaerens]EDV20918.1 predicted protein [Trichoplax adhaerens]|eukprot:XP_002116562.1 predicted protein [Trichoplax adhaerens]
MARDLYKASTDCTCATVGWHGLESGPKSNFSILYGKSKHQERIALGWTDLSAWIMSSFEMYVNDTIVPHEIVPVFINASYPSHDTLPALTPEGTGMRIAKLPIVYS